jgi:hypothetical protein
MAAICRVIMLRCMTTQTIVQRLNDASVAKRYEAYRDVDWDAPDARIDPRDPRFALAPDTALGATEWYRSLPADDRAELGLDWLAQTLRYGVAFEASLSRGLLLFASAQQVGSPEQRYAMHEVIEESHHSMMFLELIRRSGRAPRDPSAINRFYDRRMERCAVTFPEWFFLNVLSGEVFIDHDNRERLRGDAEQHPLVRRVIQIHVTEEARHVRFAEHYLTEHMPRVSWWRRATIRALLPIVLREGEKMMLRPAPWIVKKYAIPKQVMAAAFGRGSAHEQRVRAIAAPIRALASLRAPATDLAHA